MRDRWTYVAGGEPKPFVHPIVTPSGRRTLTVRSPEDHPWHRGLWFAIKFVDGDNFWEEDPSSGFGVQRHGGGDEVEWVRPSGEVALRDTRVVEHVTVDESSYAIDWTSSLSVAGGTDAAAAEAGQAADVVLDRTPYTTWGGYGGLAFRGSPEWPDTRVLLDDGSEHRRPEGLPSRWADLSGPDAGVTFLDHPGNPRHPVPWYGASRSRVYGEGWSNFLNAAFLFHEPLVLRRGDGLRFRYRVVVHDGAWSVDDAERAWESFASS